MEDRDFCEFCCKDIATRGDGEMLVGDTRIDTLCWSKPDMGEPCRLDPQSPDYPLELHPDKCRCDEHAAAYGDYLYDLVKDGDA